MTEQRVAWVTGASRGIGQAILQRLVADNLRVIGTATSESGAEAITESISQLGGRGMGMVLDVRDQEQQKACLRSITSEYGVPLVLVNNAGITQDKLAVRMKLDDWQNVVDVNLTAAFFLTKLCLRGMMKARWGRVVNVSSVVAATGNPGQANYCAAKAGLIGMTKSLAQEMSSLGITFNVIAPGFIDTDMTQGLNETQRDAILSKIPMKCLGQPSDVADAVSFLAGESARYITGQTLHVNGGMYMV